MKNGQKLKLGDAHVTPRIIQEVQASKLGDAGSIPSSSTNYQVLFQCAIFLLLYMICVILGASLFLFLVLFCFVCCNKWLDPIIHVLEETHSVLIAWNTLVFTLIVPRVFQFFQYCVQLLFPLLFMLRACLVFFTFICLALCTLLKIIYESCFK